MTTPRKSPKKHEWDRERIFQLGKRKATLTEIAQRCGVSKSTVDRWNTQQSFRETLEFGRASYRLDLKIKQQDVAMNDKHPGQATMLVWLGKNDLDQTDKSKVESENIHRFARIERKIVDPSA